MLVVTQLAIFNIGTIYMHVLKSIFFLSINSGKSADFDAQKIAKDSKKIVN